jgi:hypothetical protein
LLDGRDDQVMRERPRRDDVLHPPVDAGRLKDADDDGKTALALHLAQDNDLLLVDFGDDDPLQLHLDGHGRTSQQVWWTNTPIIAIGFVGRQHALEC